MDVTDAQLISVHDSSQVSEARRQITAIAIAHGLDQKTVDRIAVVITELATNLVKHTKGGIIVAQGLIDGKNVGIEIFTMDKGPGMANVTNCQRDGFSTTGTLGTGLGAIARMSDTFDIISSLNRGTIIQTRFWLSKTELVEPTVSGFTVPIRGERLSGDKWVTCKVGSQLYCLLVDGLGHGLEASDAAVLAVQRFKESLRLDPKSMLEVLHQSLRGSRGAVGAVAKINFEEGKLAYAGLGNITAVLVTRSAGKHLTSLNGTLGYEARKITEFTLPWSAQSTLVMYSDGLSSKTSEDLATIDVESTSAAMIAGSLFLHQAKSTDDATVMVVKQ